VSRFNLTGIGMTSQRTRDRLVQRLQDQGITDPEVLQAMGNVPRHIFIDEALAHRAYEDSSLPIGNGQTISQPFTVALMTQTLCNQPRARVLEVGTGSGYQTAVLANHRHVGRIYSVERLGPLVTRAEERLRAMKVHQVRLRHADGYLGWPEEGPFDGILVTAAPRQVPPALLEQLAEGGRLIVPVGTDNGQVLQIYERTSDGLEVTSIDQVKFVPLVKGLR
jgi:protein-L-isoaspartate(D-aspartate) O-methyltransferase